MDVNAPQFLAQLNAAASVNILDWDSPSANTYTKTVGPLTLTVAFNMRNGTHDWTLLHERGGLLASGSSEDRTLAQQEAVKYAENKVRSGMQGLLA